jgi:uncharacterized MAPEG superfamily protein
MSQLTDPVFQSYVATVVVLSLNVIGLANATAITRGKNAEVINPEDKKAGSDQKVVYLEGSDPTQRHMRAHRNALENIPLFMITGLLFVLTRPSLAVAASIFAVFTVARIGHSICYVKGIQPFRTITFVVGLLAQVVMLGVIVYKVFF